MRKKSLPTGVDDFKEIIEENYYFIDKTLLIEELLITKSKITLLPRPRRFGKSLNMSMLKYFFDIEKSEENRELFTGLKIEQTEFMEHQGKYPVIYMSFKDVKNGTWKMCLEKMRNIIARTYLEKDYLKENLKEIEKKKFDLISEGISDQTSLEESLMNLSEYMQRYYGKKTVILIDEYDTPLTTAYENGYHEEAVSFFRNLMSGAYKSNVNLELGVMTGIMRIAKESIFSGLNNLDVSTILEDRYHHFGLTENEVEELVKYYKLEYEMEDVKKWYNGYRFGEIQMYNPWSIVNFANKNLLGPHWINSSDNLMIKNILKKYNIKLRKDLESLFKGESIKEYLKETIVFQNVEDVNNIWSLLFFTGYLTYKKENISKITGAKTYDLVIPNEEVKSFFKETFVEIYSDNDSGTYLEMMEELYLGNINGFAERFKTIYKSIKSYHDAGKHEEYHHHFMLALVLILDNSYRINSNRESGKGRYDIAMFPKEQGHHGIIFEFKVAPSEEKLKEKSEEALAQIKNMEYDTEMKILGIEKVIKIGVAFCGKELEVSWE